jgi:ribulose kinase
MTGIVVQIPSSLKKEGERERESMASPPARVLVGVDIGGTSVKVGIVDLDGRVLARSQAPVDRQDSVERVVANAKAQIGKLLQEVTHLLETLYLQSPRH